MRNQKANIFIKGKGTPIVLLHSSMSSKLQWYRLMESLSQNYMAIAVDLLGYGDSPFPDNLQNFCFNDEITFIESLLTDIISTGEPIHIVGHSYGGAIGLRYCYQGEEQNPGNLQRRILSLALFEPVAYHLLPADETVCKQIWEQKEIIDSYMKNNQYSIAAKYFIDFWSSAGTFAGFPDIIQKTFLKSIKKLPFDFYALTNEPLGIENYRKIKQPVFLLAGRQSPVMAQRISILLSEYLINCRLKWINGGHMSPVYQADEVNTEIETFIRSISYPIPGE
ncbi:MAG: alpha/beta hydrolase [Acidobacteria bacterium]|nr:alpha/beta hydrolase [Acidobacteriota bacterium]